MKYNKYNHLPMSVSLLVILSLLLAGCGNEKVGETVPAPPRDLAEKSLRLGKAPGTVPQPGDKPAPTAPR